jgi:hypothetical protein
MSYCRWSSDNFMCDLYVYANVSGAWTIHVATNRITTPPPALRWPTDPKDSEQLEQFRQDRIVRQAILDAAEHLPIGLSCDGKTFDLGSPGECADKCDELAAIGYRFPSGIIAALREEQAEMDAEGAA